VQAGAATPLLKSLLIVVSYQIIFVKSQYKYMYMMYLALIFLDLRAMIYHFAGGKASLRAS
jgi:hypothetical protein